MANEINLDFETGIFPWVTLWNAVGQVWDTVDEVFVTYVTANLARYAITLTEVGTASGIYQGTFPSEIPAGLYKLVARRKAAAIDPPAEANPRCGHGQANWDGAALVPVTSAAHIADAYLDRPNAIAGATPRQHYRRTGAVIAGRASGAGGGTETFKDYAGNDAVVMTTPDDDGNRTAVSYP